MSILDDLKTEYRLGGLPQKLIFWNVGLFIACLLLELVARERYAEWLPYGAVTDTGFYRPWTLLTYAFLHAGFLHILFNMLALVFASRVFLTYFTQKQFMGLYVLSAIFSGAVFILVFRLMGVSGQMVGASAAIMAVLVAATTYNPTMPLRLALIGNVKLWHVTGVLLFLDLVQLQDPNFGGHIAHLSGAFFGFVYMKVLQSGTDLSRIVTATLDFFAGLGKSRQTTLRKVHSTTSPRRQPPVRPEKDRNQKQIDDILDKISQSGYDSLSKEEKEFLFRAGKE